MKLLSGCPLLKMNILPSFCTGHKKGTLKLIIEAAGHIKLLAMYLHKN